MKFQNCKRKLVFVFDLAVVMIVPFQEFQTVEIEKSSIKKINVFVLELLAPILKLEVEENTPLEEIWEACRDNNTIESLIHMTFNTPTNFSFGVEISRNPEDYEPDIEIESNSAVRFYN